MDTWGTHTGVAIGSTSTSAYAQEQMFGHTICPIEDVYPGGNDNVTPSVSFSNISGVAVGQTATTTATVSPSSNTTPISLSISGGAAIVSPTGTFTTTTSVVVRGLSAGQATLTATVAAGEGGSQQVGQISFNVYQPVPSKLVRESSPCGPAGGIGPLTIVNDGNVVDCSGNVIPNQCGVYRNYTFEVLDQNGSEFLTPYTITESFSSFSSTIPGDTLPAPRTSSNTNPNDFFDSDLQYVGFTTSPSRPMCLASDDHNSFTQTFTVTVNGQSYPLTTTISIQRGRYNGTYEVNSTITTP